MKSGIAGRCNLLLIFLLTGFCVNGQITKPVAFIEFQAKTSVGNKSPFYLVANRHGIYRINNNSVLLRSGIVSETDTSKKFAIGFGLDGFYRFDGKSAFVLQQGYAQVKFFFLILQCGSKEEVYGLQDRELSSGGYLISGNARPIPKIDLITNDYVTIPLGWNLFEFKAGISHGWMGKKDQYVKNAYLHQKYFFFRVGEKRWPVSFNVGLHHVAIWSGDSPQYGHLPEGWNAFWSVFKGERKDDIGPDFEQINVLGNHLGTYSLGLSWIKDNYRVDAYWHTILEDQQGQVGKFWKNYEDGLWGIVYRRQYKNTGLQRILLEFFHSAYQSGYDIPNGGNDDYFNNALYRTGWTYHKLVIGNPLITSPIYTKRTPNESDYIENNRVKALTTGVIYNTNRGRFLSKITYSANYGTRIFPYEHPKHQWYTLFEYSYNSRKYEKLNYSLLAAVDLGNHMGNNAGLLFNIRKTF